MKEKKDILNFSNIHVSGELTDFYHDLNTQVLFLCRSLPASVRTDALLFLMQYCGSTSGDMSDFFRNYHVPSWSILYWIERSAPESANFAGNHCQLALRAHAMAMLLHSMDDHICDGDIPATHLTLLLRSQSWKLFTDALFRYAAEVPGGEETALSFIDSYYSAICCMREPFSFDEYCSSFRKQMATWSVMPVLMCHDLSGKQDFADNVLELYENFGIAWRIIDDIQDIEEDMSGGIKSSIYHILPDEGKSSWETALDDGPDKALIYIGQNNIIEKAALKALRLIELSCSLAVNCGLTGLSKELLELSQPLRIRTGQVSGNRTVNGI